MHKYISNGYKYVYTRVFKDILFSKYVDSKDVKLLIPLSKIGIFYYMFTSAYSLWYVQIVDKLWKY